MAAIMWRRGLCLIPTNFSVSHHLRGHRGGVLLSSCRLLSRKRIQRRNSALNENDFDALSYDELQLHRLAEARRSVLVLHPSPPLTVIDLCRKYGRIANAISYVYNTKTYTLIEYSEAVSVGQVLSSVKQFPNVRRIAIESRLLYFHTGHSRLAPNGGAAVDRRVLVENYGKCSLTDLDLLNCSSVESQMWMLYEKQRMSDLDVRLRYFLCTVVEDTLRRFFSESTVRAFGSSVNGFGRYDCDLDLVMSIEPPPISPDDEVRKQPFGLYFLTKMRPENDRAFAQHTLDMIGGMIRHVAPQLGNVRFILNARVPIVKFASISNGIECDLCLDNRAAVCMSEVLYYLCQLDSGVTVADATGGHHQSRVSPLIFAVRHWARCNEVTRSNPGPWLSNFMLTLLVVYYMQTRPKPILPALKLLRKVPGPAKHLSADISLPFRIIGSLAMSENTEKLDELLLGFFQFYADFDFRSTGISIIEGASVTKPDESAALYIENPLERDLNVAKNVLEPHLDSFQSLCRTAHDCLRGSPSLHQHSRDPAADPWGLLTIMKATHVEKDSAVNVKELVDEGQESQEEESVDQTTSVPTDIDPSTAAAAASETVHPANKTPSEADSNVTLQRRLNVRMDRILSESDLAERTATGEK